MKDYLADETLRNHRNHKIFERLLKRAIGKCDVLVAHHLTFTTDGDEPNEIPSADTLIFDVELMGKVFGDRAYNIMQSLSVRKVDSRDAFLEHYLDGLDLEEAGVKADISHT